jgi:hypothetical protein
MKEKGEIVKGGGRNRVVKAVVKLSHAGMWGRLWHITLIAEELMVSEQEWVTMHLDEASGDES